MSQSVERSSRERAVRPIGSTNPYIFTQGGWERMIFEIPEAHMQADEPLAGELARFKTEGWKITYSLSNAEGKTLYFKRALARAPRRLNETIMW